MICPCAKKGETSVVDSRPTEDGTAIRRRRLCSCGERFTTFERIQYRELMVVKKNGRKSSFDRDKLSKSIYIALKKRPLDTETVEKSQDLTMPPHPYNFHPFLGLGAVKPEDSENKLYKYIPYYGFVPAEKEEENEEAIEGEGNSI